MHDADTKSKPTIWIMHRIVDTTAPLFLEFIRQCTGWGKTYFVFLLSFLNEEIHNSLANSC